MVVVVVVVVVIVTFRLLLSCFMFLKVYDKSASLSDYRILVLLHLHLYE